MCMSILRGLAGEKCCKELSPISSPSLPPDRARQEPCAEPADEDVVGTSPAYLKLASSCRVQYYMGRRRTEKQWKQSGDVGEMAQR